MMSTQEEDDTTTFTLSFGGVEFCLTPSCPTEADEATASDVMSISKVCNGEVCINLNQARIDVVAMIHLQVKCFIRMFIGNKLCWS